MSEGAKEMGCAVARLGNATPACTIVASATIRTERASFLIRELQIRAHLHNRVKHSNVPEENLLPGMNARLPDARRRKTTEILARPCDPPAGTNLLKEVLNAQHLTITCNFALQEFPDRRL
jgi:hypothetical protein